MPGRFSLAKDAESLKQAFPWLSVPKQYQARYNIAPAAGIPVVTNEKPSTLDFFTWGLIPSWTSGIKLTKFLVNARSETIATKPSFKISFRRRRCLILADGYYEWVKVKGKKNKVPYYVHLKSKETFAFAGLWDQWQSIDGSEIKSACTITTEPNELVAQIHHRMGAILKADHFKAWLQPGEIAPEELLDLLKPYPSREMAYHQVSEYVSNPDNDGPDCIRPLQ